MLFGRVSDRGYGDDLELFARAADRWTVRLSRATMAGHDCYRIEFEGLPDAPRVYRWWVSPECGYAVLRYDETNRSAEFGLQSRFQEAVTVKEVSPGLWMPTESKCATYRRALGSMPASIEVSANQFTSVVVNEATGRDAYDFRPPLGVSVIDAINNESWIEGGVTLGTIVQCLSAPTPDFEGEFGYMPQWSEKPR